MKPTSSKCFFSVILPPCDDGMPVPPLSLSLSSNYRLDKIAQRVTGSLGTNDWKLIGNGVVVDLGKSPFELGCLCGRENMTILQVYIRKSLTQPALTTDQFAKVNIELNEAMTHLGVLRSRVDTQADRNRELENQLQNKQNDIRPTITTLIDKYKNWDQSTPTGQTHVPERLL